MSDQKRLLADLRVIDLRAELEKRNLNKSGVRGVLIQRLAKYLEENGEDPATFKFDLSGSETKSSPTKSTRHSDSLAESKSEETPAMEDMIVQDDTGEEEETQSNSVASQSIEAMEAKPTDDNESMDSEPKEKAIRTLGMDDSEASPAKKPCLDKEDDNKTETNMDSEDSINLDLGEDELLNEETESTTIPKKDDGSIGYAAGTAGDDSPHDNAAAATDTEPAGDQANAEAAATSVDGDSAEQEPKDDRHKSAGDKKDKDESKEGGARNLWVSGLSGDTRAKDLKQLCSKHGKVIGAKVVTNAKTPGSRCYGYLTMASSQDAENCIKHLHRTELHGRMISVEKAKSESESSSRRHTHRPENEKADDKSKNNGEESNRSISRTRDKSSRSERERGKRSTRSRERKKSPKDALSFAKIAKERDLARIRERSRLAREDERRRRAAEEALRERERRQRQERHRLQLERDKLREEREKIEREKNELLRLERDRHRFEREKLELERLELKRAQLRLEEERRKRSYDGGSYRKPGSPPQPAYERHKRAPPPMSSSRQFEAPPPPRFEVSSSYDRGTDKRDRDYKRDYPRHVSSSNVKYPANGNCNDDTRQPLPPGTRPKEPSRSYESRDNRSYRPSPTAKPEPRNWSASSRYPDTTTAAKGRSGGGSGEAWSGGEQRYSGAAFPARYPAYQPPPPGAAYPDRYANREYRKY